MGLLDVVVNNAVTLEVGPLASVTPHAFDEQWAVNVKAPYFVVQAALPWLREATAPAVVNVSFLVGDGHPGAVGIRDHQVGNRVPDALAGGQVAGDGIRVNCIAPGPVDAPIPPSDLGGG